MTLAVLQLPNQPESVRRCARSLRMDGDVEVRVVERPEDAAGAERLLVPWPGHPHALAPLAALGRARRAPCPVGWVDEHGDHGGFGATDWAVQLLRQLLFRLLDGLVCLVAALLRPGRAPLPKPPGNNRQSGLTVVLPVLPDLSHTFVFREVARIREQQSGLDLVVLEHGPHRPLHPEAAALLDTARWLPARGIVARNLCCLRWLLLRPRRSRSLLRLYADQPEGWRGLFGKLPLREPRHPGRAFELASDLAGRPASAIHVYGSTYAANVAIGAAVLLDRPVSLSSYVDFDFDYSFRMLEAKYQLCSMFRVCTRFCATRMQELIPDSAPRRLPVLVWGLDVAAWRDRPEPAAPALRRDDLRLFSACRIVEKKGLHLVPPAIVALRERGVIARWQVAGHGPEAERLRVLCDRHGVSDQVEWLGSLPNDRMLAELSTADIALLPCVVAPDGERDGIPIFLTEAMALGRVVLSTPVSGIPELIVDGDTGYLVPSGEIEPIVERLLAILEQPDAARRVAARGRDAVFATQDADQSARGLLQRIHSGAAQP